MNSSWVRQPIASAMLGLIPCFVNSPRTSAVPFALLHFQVDVLHPLDLCFRLGRKVSAPRTVGVLGIYQDGTGLSNSWASKPDSSRNLPFPLLCFLAVCL